MPERREHEVLKQSAI